MQKSFDSGIISRDVAKYIIENSNDILPISSYPFLEKETVELSNLENRIAELLGSDVKPIYGPDRPGDIKHSNADISKARRLLGYDPDYSFHDGIKLCVEWYKENL